MAAPATGEHGEIALEEVVAGLSVPWSLAFLPDGQALVSEREAGRISLLDPGRGALTSLSGLPADIFRDEEISAGVFDVRPAPDFDESRWIYVVYASGDAEASGLVLARARLTGTALEGWQRLYEARPRLAGKWHFGGRLVVTDEHLFLSTGDGYEYRHLAQSLASPAGKILRLQLDGKIPADNPFVGTDGALGEIWAYGVRNPQGMTRHPQTGEIWMHEHGPQGGDELNRLERGANYGWPVISYGEEYGGGPIGAGITHADGLRQPVYYWRPSIAPSGMSFYTGDAFPHWRRSLFVGALAQQHLSRLALSEGRVLHEERLLEDRGWRVRFVEEGPDGLLYLGIDSGRILRLRPGSPAP